MNHVQKVVVILTTIMIGISPPMLQKIVKLKNKNSAINFVMLKNMQVAIGLQA
jgi:hypothetical protein